jgi:propane monooxygenase small subunit
VGVLFRSHLVMQISARNGDYVTPSLVGSGENDYNRDLGYTRALFNMLTNDPEHRDHNRELLSRWLEKWVPLSIAAARELQPIWSQPQERTVPFSESFEAAKAGLCSVLSDLDLDQPKELS